VVQFFLRDSAARVLMVCDHENDVEIIEANGGGFIG